jgi:hypothetical protein
MEPIRMLKAKILADTESKRKSANIQKIVRLTGFMVSCIAIVLTILEVKELVWIVPGMLILIFLFMRFYKWMFNPKQKEIALMADNIAKNFFMDYVWKMIQPQFSLFGIPKDQLLSYIKESVYRSSGFATITSDNKVILDLRLDLHDDKTMLKDYHLLSIEIYTEEYWQYNRIPSGKVAMEVNYQEIVITAQMDEKLSMTVPSYNSIFLLE